MLGIWATTGDKIRQPVGKEDRHEDPQRFGAILHGRKAVLQSTMGDQAWMMLTEKIGVATVTLLG